MTSFRCSLCLLVAAAWILPINAFAQPNSFNNFGVFSIFENTLDGRGRFAANPLPWFEGEQATPLPGWDANVQWDWSYSLDSDFTPVEEADPLFIAAPFTSLSTIFARDDDGNTLGSISMTGSGMLDANLNESAAIFDEYSAQVYTPYSLFETYEITEQTGIYENMSKVGDWSTQVYGRASRPWFANQSEIGMPTTNPSITASSTFVIQGQYEFEETPIDPLTLGVPKIIDQLDIVWAPAVTPNGLELYYTQWVDSNWDLHFATRESETSPWISQGEVPGTADQPGQVGRATFTPDSLTMLYGIGAETYTTSRSDLSSPWDAPERLRINANGVSRSSPSLSSDGLTLYTGPGGVFEASSLRMFTRDSLDSPWSEGVPIPGFEDVRASNPSISSNNLTMAYSDGSDLWMATRESVDDPFSTHTKLPEGFNTNNSDVTPFFAADDTLYFVKGGIPNVGDTWNIFQTGPAQIFHPGDLDRDGLPDILDVNLLCNTIRRNRTDESHDLTNDGQVDIADMGAMLQFFGATIGDTDLDGNVNFQDFLTLSESFGQPRSFRWSEGNINCDDGVNFSDFLILSTNFGGDAATLSHVPEPDSHGLSILVLLLAIRSRRSRVLRTKTAMAN